MFLNTPFGEHLAVEVAKLVELTGIRRKRIGSDIYWNPVRSVEASLVLILYEHRARDRLDVDRDLHKHDVSIVEYVETGVDGTICTIM